MKSPRFLAALAMAAALTTGVTTTAHAALGGGNATTGQTPNKQIEKIDSNTNGSISPDLKDVESDIEINGEFIKTINNFPAPTQQGRYLRVSMPIQINFTYNVDNHKVTSAQGVVSNQSVYAIEDTQHPGTLKTEFQPIKMTLAGFEKSATGQNTMGKNVKFVETVDTVADKDNIQLPLELNIDSSTGPVKEYNLKTIEDFGKQVGGITIPEIVIDPNTNLTLTIDKINGQNLGNEHLLTNHTTLTSHNLKLKFEYAGK